MSHTEGFIYDRHTSGNGGDASGGTSGFSGSHSSFMSPSRYFDRSNSVTMNNKSSVTDGNMSPKMFMALQNQNGGYDVSPDQINGPRLTNMQYDRNHSNDNVNLLNGNGIMSPMTAMNSNGENRVDNTMDHSSQHFIHGNTAIAGDLSTAALGYYPYNGISQRAILKKRVNKACDYCRKRKIRCDQVNPQTKKCTNCYKYSMDCTFEFHIELEKKRKRANYISSSRDGKSPHYHQDELSSFSSSNPSPVTDDGNITISIKEYNELKQLSEQINPSIQKLLGKTDAMDGMSRVISDTFQTLLPKMQTQLLDYEFLPRAKPKNYYLTLLTAHKMNWIKSRLALTTSHEEFFRPFKPMFNNAVKWYIVQMKRVINYSDLLPYKDNIFQTYPLPSKEQSKRLLEILHSSLLYSSSCIVNLDQMLDIIDRYYDGVPLSRHELFLLNVSLCTGASSALLINTNEAYYLRKDRHLPGASELKDIENNLFINSMFYYHKVLVNASNLTTLKALLVLGKHIQRITGFELSYNILEKAIAVAFSLGLNKQSTFTKIHPLEAIQARGLWAFCVSSDRSYSLKLSRPLLIAEGSMDVLGDDTFFNVIKEISSISAVNNYNRFDELKRITNIEEALNFIAHQKRYINIFTFYYESKLSELEEEVYKICFSTTSTYDIAIEELLCKCEKLNKKIENWRETLHPFMKLESFKEYYKLLSLQSNDENPEMRFEIILARIQTYHCRSYSLAITLGLFITSVLRDNKSTIDETNREAFSQIDMISMDRLYRKQYVDASITILQLFGTLSHQPFLYSEIMYYFFTAVFTLVFHLVSQIHVPENDLENAYLISLLETTHKNLIGHNEENLLCDNMKWNTGIFMYTFFLKVIIQYFNNTSSFAKTYTLATVEYQRMIDELIEASTHVKDDIVARLEKSLVAPGSTPHSSITMSMFGPITTECIKLLNSENADQLLKSHMTDKAVHTVDRSIFPKSDESYEDIAGVSCDSDPDSENHSRMAFNHPDDDSRTIFEFAPGNTFFFDRDFSFLKFFDGGQIETS